MILGMLNVTVKHSKNYIEHRKKKLYRVNMKEIKIEKICNVIFNLLTHFLLIVSQVIINRHHRQLGEVN